MRFFKKVKTIGLWMVLLPCMAMAVSTPAGNTAEKFVAGKDYQVLSTTPLVPQPKGKVQVIEFFSYGCPWCKALEPTMEAWLKTKPAIVAFDRVPVVFTRAWQPLARAYYAAKILGVEPKITPAMFKAIHREGEEFADPAAIKTFFMKQGVTAEKFDAAFTYSPSVDIALADGKKLMMKLKIYRVPALVIGGRYLLRADMVGGDYDKFKQALTYLVNKSK